MALFFFFSLGCSAAHVGQITVIILIASKSGIDAHCVAAIFMFRHSLDCNRKMCTKCFQLGIDSISSIRLGRTQTSYNCTQNGSPNWQPTLKRCIEWKRIELYSNGENRNGKVLFGSALDRWQQQPFAIPFVRPTNQPNERLIVRSTLNMKLHKPIFVLECKTIEREKCRYRKIVHGTDWRQIKVRHFCLWWVVVVIRSLFST